MKNISKKSMIFILLSVLILLFVFTHRVEIEIKAEYIVKANIPINGGANFKNRQGSLIDVYIHSRQEYEDYKKKLQKLWSIDTSKLPKTFDWKKYCIYETAWNRIVEISYNPFWSEYILTGCQKGAPCIYPGWYKLDNIPISDRIIISIGEKIPDRASHRDRFNKIYQAREKENKRINERLKSYNN